MKKSNVLEEKHILEAGGTYFTDAYNHKYIDLIIGEHKKLRFYNGTGYFNVYLQSTNDKDYKSIQLLVLKTVPKFKKLLSLLYDKEGVELYHELLRMRTNAITHSE